MVFNLVAIEKREIQNAILIIIYIQLIIFNLNTFVK